MFYLKLMLYYLRHPKELAAGLWRKLKRIVKRVIGAGKTEERVTALEEALAALAKENGRLKEQVERLEKDKTIRKSSALDEMLWEMAEETAETRAADPARQEAYGKVIEKIRGNSAELICVADLGCGKGIWMGELEKQGLSAVGVDSSRKAVQACREKKLNAVCADEAEWMRNCQSGAADLVVAEKAEAIGTEKIVTILAEAVRVLRDGGAAVVEIGENKVAAPVKEEMIEAVARRVGMKTETVRFKSGCAVIAYK